MNDAEHARSTAEAVARRSYGKLVAFLAARTARRRGGRGRALGRLRRGARRLAHAAACPRNPEAWLLTVGAAQADRRRRGAAHEREAADRSSSSCAEELDRPRRTTRPRHAGRPPRADVRLRASGDRRERARAAHPADRARLRRRDDRAPRFSRRPPRWASGSCARRRRSSRPAFRSRVPERDELARAARMRCSRRSTRPSPRAGPIPAGTEARAPRSRGGGDLARPARGVAAAGRARSARPARADAPRRSAPRTRGATQHGDYVPLAEQDPALWDAALIDEAEALLTRASACGERRPLSARSRGAVCARRAAAVTGRSDWAAMLAALRRARCELTGSPVVAINRAIALAETRGPQRGARCAWMRSRATRGSPTTSPTGRRARRCSRERARAPKPRSAYERAIGLERDAAVRRFLQRRVAGL